MLATDSQTCHSQRLPYGLVVRIPAFHAGGPGSIPGVGTQFFLSLQKLNSSGTGGIPQGPM